jgi:hypothetical protein
VLERIPRRRPVSDAARQYSLARDGPGYPQHPPMWSASLPRACGGNSLAARRLGLARTTLRRRIGRSESRRERRQAAGKSAGSSLATRYSAIAVSAAL